MKVSILRLIVGRGSPYGVEYLCSESWGGALGRVSSTRTRITAACTRTLTRLYLITSCPGTRFSGEMLPLIKKDKLKVLGPLIDREELNGMNPPRR